MENTKLVKITNGKDSNKDKLYGFLTSSEYNRDRQTRIESKSKLDELHRKELRIWNDREECIRKWFEIDCKLDAFVSSVTQGEDGENPSI